MVAILLLAPAVLTFSVDSYVSRRQTAMLLTARAVPYRPNRPACLRDGPHDALLRGRGLR